MSTRLLNTSYNIGAYNSSGNSYNGSAYTFRVEVLLNSQNEDNLTSNITINWYIKGNSGWYYSGWSGINTYIRLKNISLGETSFVNKANSTYNTLKKAGVEYKMLSWTGNVQHNSNGNLNFAVQVFYDGGESKNILPRAHTKNFSVENTPDISVVPNVVMNGNKFSSIQYAIDSSTIKKIRSIYLSISSSEVVEIK